MINGLNQSGIISVDAFPVNVSLYSYIMVIVQLLMGIRILRLER
jgi:hypothetical protein